MRKRDIVKEESTRGFRKRKKKKKTAVPQDLMKI